MTVTLTVSFPVRPPLSVTVSSNVYWPCTRLFTPVAAEVAFTITNCNGPEILVHWYETILPSASVPVPVKATEFVGRVIVTLLPAFAIGAWLGGGSGAAFTVTLTVSFEVNPPLSVTTNSNSY